MLDQLQSLLAQYEEQESIINQLTARNVELLIQIDKQKERETNFLSNEKVQRDASRLMALENKIPRLVYEIERLTAANNVLTAENKEFKKLNPKKLKEANKDLSKRNKEWQARCKGLLNDNKAYRKDIDSLARECDEHVSRLVKAGYMFRTIDDCHMLLWPTQLGVTRNGKTEAVASILMINSFGVGGFVTVDNGELCIPNTLLDVFGHSEMMPQEALDFAERWLTKLENQGHEFTANDLFEFSGRSARFKGVTADFEMDFESEVREIINEIIQGSCGD